MNGVIEKGFHIGILRKGEPNQPPIAAVDPANTLKADRYIEDLIDEIRRLDAIIFSKLAESNDHFLSDSN